ncbi:hypothetical protein [Haloarchaeobius sp. DFWS5]|uniref:hypothetical protein n=1 Tax=Haloarchaeobius sp. DFWS5 TaxID=3446114 RepID=UPI003EBFB091
MDFSSQTTLLTTVSVTALLVVMAVLVAMVAPSGETNAPVIASGVGAIVAAGIAGLHHRRTAR